MKLIKPAKYEGYIWYSDQKAPEVYNGEEVVDEIVLDEQSNPFIIEGNLWDEEQGMSIMIRYVDGEYLVRPIHVSKEERQGISSEEVNQKVATTIKEYQPLPCMKAKNVDVLRFLQYWEQKDDEFCADMPVLQPSKLVFIGFDKKD